MHASIVSQHRSYRSHQMHRSYRSHHMHRSHLMYARIDRIICIDRIDHITCIDRNTCMLTSIASHVCSHRSHHMYALNRSHHMYARIDRVKNALYSSYAYRPVRTHEVKEIRHNLPTHSRTSDTNLRAPTWTHMLQQLLIRHSHYRPHSSIGK